MSRWTWLRSSYTTGEGRRGIEADRIEFAPGHVVFRDRDRHVILAERNELVTDLREELEPTEPEKGSALAICDRRGYGPGSTSQETCTYGVHTGRHSWERGGRA